MISCVMITSVMRVLYSTRCMSRRPAVAAPAARAIASGGGGGGRAALSMAAVLISALARSSMPWRIGLFSPSASMSASAPSMAPDASTAHCAASVLRGARYCSRSASRSRRESSLCAPMASEASRGEGGGGYG